jgi:hypothetical protein
METRATLPICTAGVLGECFDLDTASHIATSGKTKRTIEARNPTSVIRWD